jgi:type VI secretion system protein
MPQHQDDHSPEARVAPNSQDALEAFLEGAGIPELRIGPEDRDNFFRLLGATWREAVRGTTATLMARASTKSQFRMSVTMIKPAENNPLKFAMGLENAMKALLDTKSKGRLAPDTAVREAFEDIQAHQAALLASMQRAIKYLLSQFDPVVVEERLRKRGMLEAMRPTSRKAKNWDEFAKLHEQIARTAENDFESLFREEFVQAYEDEVEKLRKRD